MHFTYSTLTLQTWKTAIDGLTPKSRHSILPLVNAELQLRHCQPTCVTSEFPLAMQIQKMIFLWANLLLGRLPLKFL